MADHSHHARISSSALDASAAFLSSEKAKNISALFEMLDTMKGANGGGGGAAHVHAAEGGHDHHSAGHEHAGHMMKMWFHGGCDEVILFDFWRTDSCLGLLMSCIIIFAMGALYEGVKWFRVYLQLSRDDQLRGRTEGSLNSTAPASINMHGLGKQSLLENGDAAHGGGAVTGNDATPNVYAPTTTPPCHSKNNRRDSGRCDGAFSVFRLVEALLYALQLVLAYWLMLIVMTYNSYLTIAVIAGAAFGHWLFAIVNLLSPRGDSHDSFTTDACH